MFGLCETFLTEDITNDMISIEGFALERKDRSETRDKLGGGLTIYFSDRLKFFKSSSQNLKLQMIFDLPLV